jgi:hypothetical protein
MSTTFALIFAKTFIALTYGGYHYWVFINRLEQARSEGLIPPSLPVQCTSIGWMIASRGVVPNGDCHRLRALWGFGIFLGLWLIGVTVAILAGS